MDGGFVPCREVRIQNAVERKEIFGDHLWDSSENSISLHMKNLTVLLM